MKKTIILVLSLLFINTIFAQSKRATSTLNWPVQKQEKLSILLQDATPFLAFSLSWAGSEPYLQIRFSEDGNNWEKWQSVQIDPHAENTPDKRVSQLLFIDKKMRYFQLASDTPEAEVNQLTAHFYSPGDSKTAESDEAETEEKNNSFCPCPQPNYQTRNDWCPAGNCDPVESPVFTNVTHLIVHHSASPNTATDWAAVVRSFWDFHVNTNGWGDIGYNWLIDPNGVVYEGRGDGVRGAHLCGMNTGTMGLCVIGNFTNVTPTQTAVDKLSEFLAWNACHREIDPLGISFHAASSGDLINISGHLDSCPTQCPGNMFYPMLPQIRSAVADHINNNCSSLAASILEAVALSDTEIELNWTDEVDGETGFEIERSKFISSLYQPIATVGANTTTYTDTDLMADTKYFYRIRAFNETDTSAYSNEVEVFTLVTSVENTLNASQVQLFPNPVKDQLFLEINHPENGKLHLEWHDLTGKAIRPALELEKTVEFQQFNLSAKDLPAGVYMLRLKLGAETGIFRIVKQ